MDYKVIEKRAERVNKMIQERAAEVRAEQAVNLEQMQDENAKARAKWQAKLG